MAATDDVKFARRIAGREGKCLAWHGDVSAEHNVAALKIVRHCLLFPESTPHSIMSLFKARQSERRTRQWDNLDLPMPKTEFKKNSLSYRAAKLWNSLPPQIKQSGKNEFIKYVYEKADTGNLKG